MSKEGFLDLSNYELQIKLGNGGFNYIHQIKKKHDKTKYAAKISPEEVDINSPINQQNIFMEANILSKIIFPSIAKFIGFSPKDFNNNPRPVIVTEFYENGKLSKMINLERRVGCSGNFNSTKKLCIIFGIASGMKFLNSQSFKIIHRNLTAESIILDNDFYPKISGFDFAILTNQEKVTEQAITGTPIYISPEIWEKGEYSESSDVYAFSMILYQLLTNQIPFRKSNIYSIDREVIKGVRPDITSFDIPKSYQNLILRCWSQDPKDRPSFAEIVQMLKEDKGFTETIDEEEYQKYIEYIENSPAKFDPSNEVIDLSKIPKQQEREELGKIFKINNENIKYRVIQEAKQEINQLSIHFKFYNNLDIKLDINKLKDDSSQRYLQLSEKQIDDLERQKVLEDIKETIDKEYEQLYNQLKTTKIRLSSSIVIKQIVRIFKLIGSKNREKIQEEVNKILDEHPEELYFNKEKLRQISQSEVDLEQIFTSLLAIKNNPFYQFQEYKEMPFYSILLSKEQGYSKSLANVLTGNCFFVTLYGKPSSTYHVLSSISNEKIKESENKLISIYGPVDIVSYARTVKNSIDKLKHFYANFPNIFFIEISDENIDKKTYETFKRWCQFISYISHLTIFCSEEEPKVEEIQKFNEFLLPEYSNSSIINCSPRPQTEVKIINENHPFVNIDIDSLNNNILRNYTFDEICKKRLDFIPYETATSLSQMIIEKNMIKILTKDRTSFHENIINDYSYNLSNKSTGYCHQLLNEEFNHVHSMIKESGDNYIVDFKISQISDKLKDKVQEFLFTNCYPELWDDKKINETSVIVNSVVENDVKSFSVPLREIEIIGKLKQLIDTKSLKDESSKALSMIKELQKLDYLLDVVNIPTTQEEIQKFNSELSDVYKKVILGTFESKETQMLMYKLSKELYDFLNANPTASDIEYGEFYSELHKKYYSPTDYRFIKSFNCLNSIRDVPYEFRPKQYTVRVRPDSFIGLEIKPQTATFALTKATTCKELYELAKVKFDLQNSPFYITRTTRNELDKPIQVEVFNDDSYVYQLDSNDFDIFYGVCDYSIKAFIESMVTKKQIKISDDFIIESNSANADYEVEYPNDHDGWFNVIFDIRNKTEAEAETEAENKEILIHLKLNAREISFLQEGNSVEHQSLQGGQWVTEEEPVYLLYPTCETAIILLRHCSEHRIIPKERSEFSQIVPEELLNFKYSRNWEGMNGNRKYDRGGKPYFVPVSFFSEGILVNDFIKYSCVGFHGTTKNRLESIIRNGFIIPSKLHGVRPHHIPLNVKLYGKENFADAVFVSPSVKYATAYGRELITAQRKGKTYVEASHIRKTKVVVVVLQVRVIPETFSVNENTTDYIFDDPHFDESELEWRIPDPKNIFPYRILYKYMDNEDFENSIRKKNT